MVELNTYKYRVFSRTDNRTDALEFIERWGRKWHNCSPPPTTGDIITAIDSRGLVVGTVSLDFPDYSDVFTLEKVYDLSLLINQVPGLERSKLVQGGRWFASVPGISRILLHAIAEYSIPRNVQYLIAEVKETSLKRMEELNIKFLVFYGLRPSLNAISNDCLRYYIDPPVPHLMLVKLDQLLLENLNLFQKN